MGSSLDQAGPLTHTVADAELIFNVIRGKDALDSTSIEAADAKGEAPRRIGVPRHLFAQGLDPDVLERFEETLEALKTKGYEVIDIELPSAGLALAVYYVIMPAEVSTNLARFDGVRYGLSLKGENLLDDYAASRAGGFGPEPRRRIMLGTYVLSSGYYDAYFGKATAARELLRAEVARALSAVDVIATPTTTSPATKLGEHTDDPLAMYVLDIFTVTANLTGNPAISVPMGTVERDGIELPVGIQFTAAHMGEASLFAVGKEVENALK
jgi:aspartyl-tRNA(Asn)/glutamyl-tRNA(Gln) amidotransferase subunit A